MLCSALALPSHGSSGATQAEDDADNPASSSRRCSWPPTVAKSAQRRPVAVNDLVELRDFGLTSPDGIPAILSPDGTTIALQMRQANASANSYCTALVIVSLSGQTAPKILDDAGDIVGSTFTKYGLLGLPLGTPKVSTLKFSPSGHQLAYTKAFSNRMEIWVVSPTSGGPRRVISSKADIDAMSWVDDTSLSFSRRIGIVQAREAIRAEARSGYRYDARFWPLASAAPLPSDSVPSENEVIDVRSGEKNPAVPPVTDGGTQPLKTVTPAGALLSTSSPKGLTAWVQAGDSVGVPATSLVHRKTKSGEQVCPQDLCREVVQLWWLGDGKTLAFMQKEGPAGSQLGLYRWDMDSRVPRKILSTVDALFGCQPAGGALLCAREAATEPRHLVSLDLQTGHMTKIFDPNPELESIALLPAQRLTWTNSFDREAYADLVLPKRRVRGVRMPLVIVQYDSRGFLRGGTGDEYPIQLFAANGMAVLSVNRPRPVVSRARGMDLFAYLSANQTGWLDYRNMVSSLEVIIDRLVSEGLIDPDRIGITGQSDGVDTATYALIHSRKFAAAALSTCCRDPAVMTNLGQGLQSWYQKSGIPGPDKPKDPYWQQGALALNPAVHPVPILFQVSDQEFRMALPTFETLRSHQWPVEMYVFPDEGHVKIQPAHRLAVYERGVSWMKKQLSATTESTLPHR